MTIFFLSFFLSFLFLVKMWIEPFPMWLSKPRNPLLLCLFSCVVISSSDISYFHAMILGFQDIFTDPSLKFADSFLEGRAVQFSDFNSVS